MARVALETQVLGITRYGSYIMHIHDVDLNRIGITRVHNCPACRLAVKLRFEPVLEKLNERFYSTYKQKRMLNFNTKHFVNLKDVRKRFTFKADLLDLILDLKHDSDPDATVVQHELGRSLWDAADIYLLSGINGFNIRTLNIPPRYITRGTRENEYHPLGTHRPFKARQYQPNRSIQYRLHHA